eukprot:Rhum_TRINITY_DN8646_c0_g1::Rhum_TRINITY_DN8646_c0_g1_i1::g.29164::m.29164
MHCGYSRRGTSPYDPVFATTSVSPPPHCAVPLGSCSPVHPFHPAYATASTSPAHQQLRHSPPAASSPSPASSLSPPHRQQQQRLSALRARSAALRAGMRVRLSERGRTSSALSQHDVGTIVRADGPAHIAPYKVQAPSGAEGWYAANELVPVDPGDVAPPPATVALTPGAVLPPPPLGGGGAPGGSLVYHVTANRGVPIGLSCKLLGGSVVVAYVEPHSPAHNAGLTPGCVVRSLGGVPVTRLSDVKVALARLRSGAHLERVVLPVEVARTAGAGAAAGTAPVLEELVQERMDVIAALQRRSVSPRRREAALRAQHDEARAARAADPVYYSTPSPSPSPSAAPPSVPASSPPRVGAPQTPPLPPVTSEDAPPPPPPAADALAASLGAASQPASVGGG